MMKDDFTELGARIEGAYENDRNREHGEVFKQIIREAFGVADVICGHHLIFEYREKRADGFEYTIVQEFPSADTVIFDHDIARKIWGKDYLHFLYEFALEPPETRDALVAKRLAERSV